MNLRVVIPIAIILLMAGQSLAVQFLTLDRWKDFVLLDLAAAALLVQFCRPYLLRVCIVLQGMCSLFVLSYHTALGMSPTLADLINGTAYAIDMGAISLFYHVDMIALVWLVPCCGLLFLLCGKKYSLLAVKRNRARRLLWESFRLLKGSIEVRHLLLIPRRRMEKADRRQVTRELAGLLAKAGLLPREVADLPPEC